MEACVVLWYQSSCIVLVYSVCMDYLRSDAHESVCIIVAVVLVVGAIAHTVF